MTENQMRALNFIKRYLEAYGYSPSYQEIATVIPGNSKSAASRVVRALARQGLISYIPNSHRSIVVLDQTQPVSLVSFSTSDLVTEVERRGLVVGHIYRDEYGAREFRKLGSSDMISLASPAQNPTYGPEN